jgi:type II secretory pathway component PulF
VAAEKKIACGELVAGAMADVHGFPLIFVHSVATAEEAGLLDQEMNSWAAAEMIEARESLQRATEWLPRLFYGLVVLYVAWRIIAMVAHHYSEMGRMIENL